MAENRREKDKRFYFSRGQMVLLGGAFALASVVIFFLGVFTGKGIEERRIVKMEEPPVKIPIKPAAPGGPAGQGGTTKEEMTFYNTLTKPTGAEPSAEPKPKETKPAEKTAKPESKESKPQTKEAPPAPKPVEKKTEKTPSPETAPKPAPPVKTAESKESGKGWTVQVNAFPDERSAKTWVDRLKNKGYNAYVAEVKVKGKIWYRVRVGQYGSREEAKKVEEALKTKENYSKAFIASR
ncbi:MAG TPA: SPOR domain-containing protein [Candidatus Binatia bacterium]|nr:SPOR domain-containing protein [Candidatus Binatia bacterium]